MDVQDFLKRATEQYQRENPPDFVTHCNYIECLNLFSRNLTLSHNLNIRKRINESGILSKKITLIRLTLQSIKAEYETINKHPDYAVMCVSWISVKSYYLLFDLFLILKYLITSIEGSFSSSHKSILSNIDGWIDSGEIVSNKNFFNNIYSLKTALSYRAKVGSNIKIVGPDLKERFSQIIKKLAEYKLEEFKRLEKIENFRMKKDKEKKEVFLDNSIVNVCDFFYCYRIKANYRDLEFLDKEIDSGKFKEFYCNYYELTISFYNAFRDLINQLSIIRLDKEILEL